MANTNLRSAKRQKNDEFYTQYSDIQKEINAYLEYDPNVFRDKIILLPCDDPEWSNFTKFFAQNFENFGLKKLISTSYAYEAKIKKYGQLDLFNDTDYITANQNFKPEFDKQRGKIFTLTRRNKRVDINDLRWNYLNGDGDFRSDEVKQLRDESDFIITNPPFSLFREFISWVFESDKQFLTIGNINAISYKENFPYLKNNRMWLGVTGFMSDMVFQVPKGTEITPNDKKKAEKLGYVGDYTRIGNSCWFTNIDHGRRHKPLQLLTIEDNIRFNKKLKGSNYKKYDNYDALEIPYVELIPSDYPDLMGVPITFLDKYNPDQFEIIGFFNGYSPDAVTEGCIYGSPVSISTSQSLFRGPVVDGKAKYFRIIIKRK